MPPSRCYSKWIIKSKFLNDFFTMQTERITGVQFTTHLSDEHLRFRDSSCRDYARRSPLCFHRPHHNLRQTPWLSTEQNWEIHYGWPKMGSGALSVTQYSAHTPTNRANIEDTPDVREIRDKFFLSEMDDAIIDDLRTFQTHKMEFFLQSFSDGAFSGTTAKPANTRARVSDTNLYRHWPPAGGLPKSMLPYPPLIHTRSLSPTYILCILYIVYITHIHVWVLTLSWHALKIYVTRTHTHTPIHRLANTRFKVQRLTYCRL